MYRKIIAMFACAAALSACSTKDTPHSATVQKTDLVNPFIGTGGHGHTFPGATVPYGMVQLSPDTRLQGWDACSGYHASDSVILGFSHTHLSGTGIGDYGDILFQPVTGEKDEHWTQGDATTPGYRSFKTPGSEHATPGYYTVQLADYGVKAEVTATAHAGMHRYTFPADSIPGVMLDLSHHLQTQQNLLNRLVKVNDRELRGVKITRGWAKEQRVYFHAVFSEPFELEIVTEPLPPGGIDDLPTKAIKARMLFKTLAGKPLLVKVGISAVDYDGAKNNVMNEIADWDFDAIKDKARQQWEQWLSRIDIKGGTDDQRKIFYTALYHTAISPNVYTDVDGRYRGMDRKIHQSPAGQEDHTVFSLWDTFRAFHPLMTLVNGPRNESWIRALLQKYDECGTLAMWELSSNETGTMIGYHSVPVIVDAYMKGYRNFDAEKAYAAIVQASTYDTTGVFFPGKDVQRAVMPLAKYYNETLGFIPCDKENESVAKALEYAYNDWCIAQMAKALGKTADYEKYTERGKRYARYFDKATGFMRGVNSDKSWKTPFSPRFSNHGKSEYVEGNAWQWSWFVPHDVEGLVALQGGKELFIKKLDSLFSISSEIEGENKSDDISGLIGQYAHGNEPSHHITYFYNYVGQPWKTQELVDEILTTLYFNNENGLSGNEDCGAMSAWYVMSAMGIYQVAPGDPRYTLGRPLFDEVTLHPEGGKPFTIRAVNNGPANKYASKITLNDQILTTPFITHEDIVKGGTLEFTMTATRPAAE
ncbi:GH92 family glycosyl hydrolase [Dawidia soli]|uniref:GH92 family glycosyl hydrolase n=1 Tax=Dawidia soli TaxID=2782352 RepID=A0AAP2DDJ0_9BACT|nr:GH92 family glycosyl hydrolase [Dawidia soli]MBT1689709.1 GH92 family glycosyl hydrolase [Dawidia soli]